MRHLWSDPKKGAPLICCKHQFRFVIGARRVVTRMTARVGPLYSRPSPSGTVRILFVIYLADNTDSWSCKTCLVQHWKPGDKIQRDMVQNHKPITCSTGTNQAPRWQPIQCNEVGYPAQTPKKFWLLHSWSLRGLWRKPLSQWHEEVDVL